MVPCPRTAHYMEKEVPIFFAGINYASLSTSTYRLSQIVERQSRRRDILHPAIDSSSGDRITTKVEKGVVRGCGHGKEGDNIDVSQNGGRR